MQTNKNINGLRIWGVIYITLNSVTFLNVGTFSWTLSVQDLTVILKRQNVQSLNKAFDFFNIIKNKNFVRGSFTHWTGAKKM